MSVDSFSVIQYKQHNKKKVDSRLEKNTDRLYMLIITTIIGILFLGGITYGIFQAAHTMLNSQSNTAAMRDRTAISKQNIASDLAAITSANIKFNGKDPITGQKVIKEFTKDGLNYSVNTDTSTVSVTGMTDSALSTDSNGHISLTIPKTVTDSQNKSYTVTSIADQAFMNRKIYKVTLPDSIVYIGAQAFYNSHLGDLTQDGKFNDITVDQYNQRDSRSITIPSNIKFIGREAFANNYLYSISIPNADDLASLDVTATDHNAIEYKSADQINTSPVDTKFDKAFVMLQYSSASAYDKMVNSSITNKYTFVSGPYQDYFIITHRPNNLLTGTSSDLKTAPDSSGNLLGGHIYNFSSDELKMLAGGQFTIRAFIHNTTNHTVNLTIWTNGAGLGLNSAFGIGTGVPAGTDGYSTITAYKVPSYNTMGDISIRAVADNTAISGVQYKNLNLEKDSVATP